MAKRLCNRLQKLEGDISEIMEMEIENKRPYGSEMHCNRERRQSAEAKNYREEVNDNFARPIAGTTISPNKPRCASAPCSPRRKVRCTTSPTRPPNSTCTKRKPRRWSSGSDSGSPCRSSTRRTNEKIPEETTKRPASPKCHQPAEYFEAPTLPVQTFSCPPPNTSQIPIPLYSQSPQKRCCCPPKTKKETPAKKSKCICGPKNKPTSKLSTISKEASVQMMENAINLCKCEMELQALKQLEEEKIKRLEAEAMAENFQKMLEEAGISTEVTAAVEENIEKEHVTVLGAEAPQTLDEAKEVQKKLEYLEERNEVLRKSLEQEVAVRKKSLDMAKKDIKMAKKVLKEKVGKIQTHAVKSVKKLEEAKGKLAHAVKERDDHLRRLSNVSEKLAKEVRSKEENCNALRQEYEKLQTLLQSSNEKVKNLEQANDKLANLAKERQMKLEASKKDAEKLQKALVEHKNEFRRSQGEVEQLKKKMYSKPEGSIPRERQVMEDKVRQARQRERASIDESEALKLKVMQLQNEQTRQRKNSDNELQRLMEENRKLREEQEKQNDKMKKEEAEMRKKSDAVEEELRRFSKVMEEKEKSLTKERDELKALVKQLKELTKNQKRRIDDLLDMNNKQEILLKSQKLALESKEEQTRLAEAEASTLRRRSFELEKKVVDLHSNLGVAKMREEEKVSTQADYEKQIADLRRELDQARATIETLEDNILIKENIINDQKDTIDKLKTETAMKSDELKKAKEEVEKKSEELQKIQDEADATVEELKKKEEELRRTSVEQKKTSILSIQAVQDQMKAKDLTVALQKKELELQKKVLCKEKCQAIHAARFATQKLLETVADFQSQVETQKKVQRMLTGLLQEKEEQLMAVTSHMFGTPAKMRKCQKCMARPLTFVQDNYRPQKEVHETFYKRTLTPLQGGYNNVYNPSSKIHVKAYKRPGETSESYESASSMPFTNVNTLAGELNRRGVQMSTSKMLTCFCPSANQTSASTSKPSCKCPRSCTPRYF